MGENTLATRSNTTITADWFNDIKTALDVDHVPRNASGVATDQAGSLGTSALTWLNAYVQNLFVGGNQIDTSDLVKRADRIISGKATANGYPDFLEEAGAAAGLTATLEATATDFVASINSTSVTVTSDTDFTGLTAAPSSNNTCQVDDGDLSDQAETKVLGELDGAVLPIKTIGSEISSLDGTIGAFLKGSEVFLAEIDTTNTQLKPIYRGWAKTDRETLANNDTLTLLKVNTLMLKNDGIAKVASVSYPATVTTSPASSSAGLNYIEREANRHAYDTGAVIDYDYMVVGWAVCDDTDCLYVQEYDFDLIWDDSKTLDYKVKDSTTVTIRRNSQISINGQSIEFFENVDLTQAANMDGGESIAADTIFYIYVDETGAGVFSSVTPRPFDPFKRGLYHPQKYFRAVGIVYTDGSNNFKTKLRNYISFTADGAWIAPPDVYYTIVSGCGGGGGGGGGAVDASNASGGSGGGAATYISKVVIVNPGTEYTVTIGAGGSGGAGSTGAGTGSNGGFAVSSFFDSHKFPHGGHGQAAGSVAGFSTGGKAAVHSDASSAASPDNMGFGEGGDAERNGGRSLTNNFSGGSTGATDGAKEGGGGGGASIAAGGAGGAGNASGDGSNGITAGANSGSGGGGGGASSTNGGDGGNGGSGFIELIWFESL